MKSKKTVLFIDGENFLFPVAEILKARKLIRHKSDIKKFSIDSLIKSALSEYEIDSKKFYVGKIHIPTKYPELVAKSQIIAGSQRRLKRSFMNQGVEFIMAGHVRLQSTKVNKKGKTEGIFKEKGTDVRLAVDMISMACDNKLGTVLLLSSDSDMQPAVKELKHRGAKVIYIGFENRINSGLSQTTDGTILIRQKEVISAWDALNQPKLLEN